MKWFINLREELFPENEGSIGDNVATVGMILFMMGITLQFVVVLYMCVIGIINA
jgi:hypothetical protein